MAKIIQIGEETVSIGKEDGSFIEVPKASLNFIPVIGDKVELFTAGEKVVVSKAAGIAPTAVLPDDAKKVNKIVYIILAILLGDLGIHKFYVGKIGMGVVYLLFCWTGIPGIIGLVEGILAIGKPADNEGNMAV